MPQPVSNTTTLVSGSLLANKISYVVDGQGRNYRGGFGGLSWMSEVPPSNNVIFIGNTTTIGRGPADKPLFYPSFNNTEANIVYAVNTLPGSPGNLTTLAGAYNWATTNNFFINNSDNPIARIDADGLVFYTDAGQPTSYPQTGTSVYDLSGNSNVLTLVNGVTFNSNGYFTTDGVDDFLSSTNPQSVSNISGSDPFTFSSLFQLLQYPSSPDSARYTSLLMKGSYNPSFGISLVFDLPSGGVYTRARTYSGVRNLTLPSSSPGYGNPVQFSNASFALNRWYKVDFTSEFSGTTYTFKTYVNGTLDNSSNQTDSRFPVAFQNNSNLTINSSPLGGSGILAAMGVAQSLVYNKALSDTEIKQNYFQSNIVTDGLVFMADASNLVSYPKSGTTTYSLTGSFSGSLVNGTGYSPNNGGVFTFDGTNDYIQMPYDSYWDNNVFGTATNFTISCWAKPNLFMNWDTLITKNIQGWYSSPEGASIWTSANGFQGVFSSGVLNNPAGSTVTLSYDTTNTQKWYHVCFTGDGTTLRLYVDGIQRATGLVASRTVPVVTASVGPSFGLRDFWNGEMTGMMFYTRGITAAEVLQNYEATKDKFLGSNIVTNGLVMYLDAADKDSYSGTGTSWDDLSGNENNGTLTNGPSFLPSVNGGIFDFDGVDDWVDCGNILNYTSGPFSFGYWVNFDSFTTNASGQGPIVFYKGPFNTRGYYVQHGSTTFSFVTNQSGAVQTTSGTGVNTVGVWYYVVITRNGASVRTYVNGVDTTSSAGSHVDPASSSENFRLAVYSNSIWMNGKISNFTNYNRTLTATEVLQNFNTQKQRFGY